MIHFQINVIVFLSFAIVYQAALVLIPVKETCHNNIQSSDYLAGEKVKLPSRGNLLRPYRVF